MSRIGRGGSGVVYLAEHDRLGRRVALKILAPEAGSDEGLRRRFVHREARLAASIEHPNVVPVYDAGEEPDGSLWIAMRFVDGPDLGRLLDGEGSLAPERTLHLLGQVAAALDAAHAKGLVHRDVKPENILVEGAPPGEHAYLTDFGLTRRTASSRLTATGSFLGTVHYASPESIVGRSDVDGRTDVYSLGCVLFRCLTGSVPFPQPTDIAVLWSHLNSKPPDVTAFRPDIPREMDEVLRTAMAKVPEHRYPSAGALVEAASNTIGSGSADAAPPRTDTRVGPRASDAPGPAEPSADTLVLAPDGPPPPERTNSVLVHLIPLESRGRRSAKHQVRIENTGSTATRVHLEAGSRTAARAEVAPDSVVVAPEGVAWSGVWVRPARMRAFGRRRLPFQVLALPEGSARVVLDGAMVRPRPLLAWGLASLLLVGAATAGTVAMLRSSSPHPHALVSPSPPVSPSPSSGVTTEKTCPLTGTPAPENWTDGPALAVKVDNENSPDVRGLQQGLLQADVVFEEPIEGGLTRLVAVFQCSMPELVGPVRGPRPTDPGLLRQLGRPVFAFTKDRLVVPLNMSGLVEGSERIESGAYHRIGAALLHNMFVDPVRLLETVTSSRPQPMFQYSAAAPAGPVTGAAVRVPFENLVWRYDDGFGLYARYYGQEPHSSNGRQITAANVIVERVRVDPVRIAGDTYPLAHTVGHGQATVSRNGVTIPGTWSRPTKDDPTVFRDQQGTEIQMAPGPTWVELVPTTA